MVIGFVAVLFVTLIVVGAIASSKRRRALQQLASELGLRHIERDNDLHSDFGRFEPLDRGRSRRAKNLLHGRRGEIEWHIFDYQYRTGSGKDAKTHDVGVIVASTPLRLPSMRIRPEGMFDKLAALAGFDDINFESEHFNRRYHVKSADRRACYDVLHPRMIEYLMEVPDADWQFSGPSIALIRRGFYPVQQIEPTMRMIEGFVQRIPGYVKRDHSMISTEPVQ